MKSLADGLPPDIARQVHPDWRRNEADYWAIRDQLLAQYQGQWIGFADGKVVASGTHPVKIFQAAREAAQHSFVICVAHEKEFETAFHESGHAVIAHDYGVIVTEVSLEGKLDDRGRIWWEGGNTSMGRDVDVPVEIAAIAVAGPIADVKFQVATLFRDNRGVPEDEAFVQTSIDVSFADAIRDALAAAGSARERALLRQSGERDTAAPQNGDRLDATVAYVTGQCGDQAPAKCGVHLANCGHDAQRILTHLPTNDSKITETIKTVLRKFNEPIKAQRVLALARELVRAPLQHLSDGKVRKCVDGALLARILNASVN